MSDNKTSEQPVSSTAAEVNPKRTRQRERKRVEFDDTPSSSRRGSHISEKILPYVPEEGTEDSVSHADPRQSPHHNTKNASSSSHDDEASRRVQKTAEQLFAPKPKPALQNRGAVESTAPDQLPAESSSKLQKANSELLAHEMAQKLAESIDRVSTSDSQRPSKIEALLADSSDMVKLNEGAVTSADRNRGDVDCDNDEPLRPIDRLKKKFNYNIDPEPETERDLEDDYILQPKMHTRGILASMLSINGAGGTGGEHMDVIDEDPLPTDSRTVSISETLTETGHSMGSPKLGSSVSETDRPKKRSYSRSRAPSTTSLGRLVGSSFNLAWPTGSKSDDGSSQSEKSKSFWPSKRNFNVDLQDAVQKFSGPDVDAYRIKVHLALLLSRQRYLLKLCRALMEYGAPTHRLEAYMQMSARVLEIDGQFLYMPGCMIVAFDDLQTHTTEVKLLRVTQGIDLGKLRETHEIYKEVVYDRLDIDKAIIQLDKLLKGQPRYGVWIRVLMHGIASALVAPFAFHARFIDMPLAFILGGMVGWMKLVVTPRSEVYSDVFEIGVAILTSFLSRALGSINKGNTFCFSALAQSSIALILPGFSVLCAAVELQSKSLIAGSTRMVHAILFSVFLGFGITIGSAIYGFMDSGATSDTQCRNPIRRHWQLLFVPPYTLCLLIINQAKWKQMPLMIFIANAGYSVTYFASKKTVGNEYISSTIGAFVIGIFGNMHSRFGVRVENWVLNFIDDYFHNLIPSLRRWYKRKRTKEEGGKQAEEAVTSCRMRRRRVGSGLAAAAILPAVLVQVPGGIAVNGSLVAGIASADQITHANGTAVADVGSMTTTVSFNVGYIVVQVAIGITAGLFLSAVFIYPLGKRRRSMFSF